MAGWPPAPPAALLAVLAPMVRDYKFIEPVGVGGSQIDQPSE